MKPSDLNLAAGLAKVDSLTIRERAILFLLLLAVLWTVFDAVLLGPQDRARQAETSKLHAAQARLAKTEQTLAIRVGRTGPAAAARQRLDAARRALDARMEAASRLRARMVAPKDMVQVLQTLLANQPGLRLVRMHTLPPEPVGLAANAKPEEAALYRHGITLTLAGNYPALIQYIAGLEKLPVGFYWMRAELDATAHPSIELTLTLNTLSLEHQWLTL